ncbi:MAG: 4Fe-4S dicluster domain-containing protein [Candidatus Omnitrophota bacterium]
MAVKKLSQKKDPQIKIFCDLSKCVACKTCELACAVEHSQSKDLERALSETTRPKKRVAVSAVGERALSIHCQHCQEAPCVSACMSGAMQKDPASGATIQDKDKCVGCWMCVMVCPFGAIVRDIENHIAVKCDLCPDRDDYACVAACPTGALFSGTKEEFEKKLKEKKVKK